MTATTHPQSASVCDGRLYVAFELSNKSWVLALTAGFGAPIWEQRMIPQDWRKLQQVLAKARAKFSLAAEARVVSCYEAGRDGFWLHDALLAQGLENRVVDSSSIEVNRRARRNKTDRIDARKLVQQLVRVALGERHVWREVRVPPVAERAARHCSRGRHTLVAEQTRLINQLRGWLQTWGATLPTRRGAAWWERVRDWRGETLPAEVQEQLALASARLALVAEQLAAVEATQAAAVVAAPADAPVRRLVALRGIAVTGASILLDEGLVWRDFRNRREVGGLLGLAPTEHSSGELQRTQGISHAGNRRLKAVAIQLAWSWVRWQKTSALTQWYLRRFSGSARLRRIGIVAVARKLLIALWRYVTTGVVPEGAILKTA